MIRNRPGSLTEVVLKTPPFKCNPGADVEVHSLTGSLCLFMYLAAIKSLLRFYGNIAVVAHDDGTLCSRDRILLGRHIPGVRIIGKKFSDKKVSRSLRGSTACKKYRASSIIAIQLFDYALFSNTRKYISLDSDVLFFRRPDKLINWITGKKKEIICSYEIKPSGQREFLSRVKCDFPPHICAGFFCFYKELVNVARIDEILASHRACGWYTTQNILPVLIRDKATRYKISFFDPGRYQDPQGFIRKPVFRHYWNSRGISDVYASDLLKTAVDLIQDKRPLITQGG